MLKPEKINLKKYMGIACLAVLLISLVPTLYVGRYAHPTGDDILYGLDAHMAWEETGSAIRAVEAALKGVAHDYETWQGTFVAMLIMRLQPTVFSENAYWLTPFIVIGLLLAGSYYALSRLAKYSVPMDRWEKIGIWSLLMMFCIQFVHTAGEAFYWFNGGVYYSGFFGVMLLVIGLFIELICAGNRKVIPWIYILTVAIGGSNYITLLLSLILLFFATVYLWLRGKRGRWIAASDFLILLVCLAISASAPGNAVRQATVASMNPIKAIIHSLLQGFNYMNAWINGWWLLGAIILLVFMLPVIDRMNFKFSYPMIVAPFLYGIFCAMQCPTMYAESSTGPGRVVNIIFYGFVIISYSVMFYLVGWCYKKVQDALQGKNITAKELCLHLKGGYLIVFAMLVIIQMGIGLQDDSIKNTTGVKALADIVSGVAKEYHEEYEARLNIMREVAGQDIVFAEFEHKPKTIYVGDYAGEAAQDSNVAMAKWFHQNSVRIQYW